MNKILISLLSIGLTLQTSDLPKIPGIIVYSTASITFPLAADVVHAINLHNQAKKHDFKSSSKLIQGMQDRLVNASDVASPEWNKSCESLNKLQANEKMIENHLSLRECFKTAQKQTNPFKLSCRALGFAGFLACIYKQSKG